MILDKQHAFDGENEKLCHVRKGDNASERAISYLKPAVHLHTPNRLIAEFNMGAYEYALSQR